MKTAISVFFMPAIRVFSSLSLFIFRTKNRNKNPTIISRDCVGGVLYKQLGLKFLSPTINLFFSLSDFNYFCLYLDKYISFDLIEDKNNTNNYPKGLLVSNKESIPTITIHFMHYNNFEEASFFWNKRKDRIDLQNIYVISTCCYSNEKKELNEKIISDFNKIKYKKMVFVDNKYGFDNEFIVKKPYNCTDYAYLLKQSSIFARWKRLFNYYNFVNFLKKRD